MRVIATNSMSHIPSAWGDVKMDSLVPDDMSLDTPEKRKRRRPTPKHKNKESEVSKVAEKESASDKIHECFDGMQVPAKKNKKTVMDAGTVGNSHSESNANIRKTLEHFCSDLPKQPEVLEKMILGMSKNLQQIVSESSYRCTLKGVDINNVTYTNEIRSVSKSYEDSYLRQSVSGSERPCVRGAECECMFIDTSQSFVGVEYILPWEPKNTKNWGMCLPCLRASTQILFYDIMHSGVHVNGLIQRFYNEHSKAGEYRLSAMLICPPSGPIQVSCLLRALSVPVCCRVKIAFYYCSERNNVVVLFASLRVQSIMLTRLCVYFICLLCSLSVCSLYACCAHSLCLLCLPAVLTLCVYFVCLLRTLSVSTLSACCAHSLCLFCLPAVLTLCVCFVCLLCSLSVSVSACCAHSLCHRICRCPSFGTRETHTRCSRTSQFITCSRLRWIFAEPLSHEQHQSRL